MRQTLAVFSKASRRPLTSKMANKDFYKGNRQGSLPGGHRTGPPGRHTKWGGYVLDDTKVRVFIAPPPSVLEASELKPFVYRTARLAGEDEISGMGGRKSLRGPGYRRILTTYQREQAIETAKKLSPLPEPTDS